MPEVNIQVILESKKIKSVTASTFSPSICHEVIGPDAIILVILTLSFKPAFLLSSVTSSRGSSTRNSLGQNIYEVSHGI